MQEIYAKKILYKFKYDPSSWFGVNYNMNLYRGCCHGCIYCDSRSECYRVENFDTVTIKKNCIEMLAKELKSKRSKGIVGIGAMSDPYNIFEKEHQYTRKAIQWIDFFNFGISIVTKSGFVTRDIDLFKNISLHSPVVVKITVTAADDSVASIIEPAADLSSERFASVKKLADNGVFTGVMMMPLLPFINDTVDNVAELVKLAHENGARFIFPSFGVTLRDVQRDYFYSRLDEKYPGLKERYIKTFGNAYSCNSPDYKKLTAVFKDECRRCKMIYRMPDIIAASQADLQN